MRLIAVALAGRCWRFLDFDLCLNLYLNLNRYLNLNLSQICGDSQRGWARSRLVEVLTLLLLPGNIAIANPGFAGVGAGSGDGIGYGIGLGTGAGVEISGHFGA